MGRKNKSTKGKKAKTNRPAKHTEESQDIYIPQARLPYEAPKTPCLVCKKLTQSWWSESAELGTKDLYYSAIEGCFRCSIIFQTINRVKPDWADENTHIECRDEPSDLPTQFCLVSDKKQKEEYQIFTPPGSFHNSKALLPLMFKQ